MKRNISLWGFVVSLMILFASCDEKTYLNSDSIPQVDGINVFFADSFRIFSSNYQEDSIETSSYFFLGLGNCADYPYTGSVKMDLYTQFSLIAEQFNFSGENVEIDSVVLVMPYGDVYIDSTDPNSTQNLHVYRLTDTLGYGVDYYDYSSIAKENTPLNADPNQEFDFRDYRDSVEVNGKKQSPQIRIKLNSAFTNEFNQLDSTTLSSSTNFINWLPGICVQSVSPNSNSLAYINSSNCQLQVFYKSSLGDSLIAYFPYNPSYNNHFTHIEKLIDPGVQATLDAPNPDGEEWTYMSFAPGITTRVNIPYIEFLEDYIVNDAVLEFTAENTTLFPMVSYLFPYKVTSDTNKQFIIDYAYDLNVNGFMMGEQEEVNKPGIGQTYKYELRITKELIASLLAKENLDLEIGPLLVQQNGTFYSPLSKRSTKLGGNNRSDEYKLKLKIIYSKR